MKSALIITLLISLLTGCVPWNVKPTDPRVCDKGTVDYWMMWAFSEGILNEVCAKALGEIEKESPLDENEGL